MNIILRLAERAGGGIGGPASSTPPVIDLAKPSFEVHFIAATWSSL
jgi:hypothetical protein